MEKRSALLHPYGRASYEATKADHAERRSVPQPRARIRSRDCVPRVATLLEAEAADADVAGQAVHVSGQLRSAEF